MVAAAALLVLVYGGYGHHWRWTGVNRKAATLWDRLRLLLLPLAAGILPIAVGRRAGSRLDTRLPVFER